MIFDTPVNKISDLRGGDIVGRASIFSLIFIMTLANLYSAALHAKLLTADEATASYDTENTTINIKSDGSYKITTETTVTLLLEQARDNFSSLKFGYDPVSEKFKVSRAEVINKGITTQVSRKSIVEKAESADDEQGFTSDKSVIVALPNLAVGTHLHFQTENVIVPKPNYAFFSTTFMFGEGVYQKQRSIEINSAKKLFVQANDPSGYLNVTQDFKSGQFHLEITLLRPIFIDAENEGQSAFSRDAYPWVSVSTENNWAEAFEPYALEYEKILKGDFPEQYQTVVNKASLLSNDEEKFAFVLASIQEQIHYFGDWRKAKSGQIPHPLQIIANRGYGDCKDMATSTVSVLRKLGYEANVAFINRGIDPVVSLKDTSVIFDFNHAIVRVKTLKGEYWLDPTNKQAYASINPDIMNRPALVVAPDKKSLLAMTPLSDARENIISSKKVVVDSQPYGAAVSVNVFLSGAYASPFTAASLRQSTREIDLDFLKLVGASDTIQDFSVTGYDLRSRVVAPIKIKVNYKDKTFFSPTSTGKSLEMEPVWGLTDLLATDQNRFSDLSLGFPRIRMEQTILKDQKFVGELRPDCWIDSPWMSVTRTEKQTQEGLKINRIITFKKDRIPAGAFTTPEFQNLQRTLSQCFNNFAFVIKPMMEAMK